MICASCVRLIAPLSTRMSPTRLSVRCCVASASSSCSLLSNSARRSRLPRRSLESRGFSLANTTVPSTKKTSTSCPPVLSVSRPVLVWCPISWRMSAMPKSFSVPERAILRPLLCALAREQVAQTDRVHGDQGGGRQSDPHERDAAGDGQRVVGDSAPEHDAREKRRGQHHEGEAADRESHHHVTGA